MLLVAFSVESHEDRVCVRLKDDWWLAAREFLNSPLQEKEVTFCLPKKDRDKLAGFPEMLDVTITCRLVKVVLDSGEIEILCTSLLDTEKYPISVFPELYHYRWTEEEGYKLLGIVHFIEFLYFCPTLL